MPHIIGISGSLRRASFNTSLLRAASELAPAGTAIDIASIAEIPLYNFDIESAGVPPAVPALKDKVAAAVGCAEDLSGQTANTVFDADGKLIDEGVRERLKKFVEDFAVFCAAK